jgi:hypothetical protein
VTGRKALWKFAAGRQFYFIRGELHMFRGIATEKTISQIHTHESLILNKKMAPAKSCKQQMFRQAPYCFLHLNFTWQ